MFLAFQNGELRKRNTTNLQDSDKPNHIHPGLSPGDQLSTPTTTGMRSSELLSSDESIVDTPKEKSLAESMDSTNESTAYEKDDDDTTITDSAKYSCIALRTRSRDLLDIIKLELQQSMNRDMDHQELETSGELEFTLTKTVDSLTLPRYQPKHDDNKRIMETLSNLDNSLETMSRLDEKFEKDMELDRYARKAISVIERGKKIVIPEDFKQNTQEVEKKGEKNLTFLLDRPKYESALVEVIKALELLSQVDISCIPAKNLENIVKLLLALCTDCNKKVQNLHETMAMMAKYIEEFMTLGHKADTLDSYKLKLEGDIQKLILENSNLKGEVIRVQNIITGQMGIEPVNVNNNEKKK